MAGGAKDGELATNEIGFAWCDGASDKGRVEPAESESAGFIMESRELGGGVGSVMAERACQGAN